MIGTVCLWYSFWGVCEAFAILKLSTLYQLHILCRGVSCLFVVSCRWYRRTLWGWGKRLRPKRLLLIYICCLFLPGDVSIQMVSMFCLWKIKRGSYISCSVAVLLLWNNRRGPSRLLGTHRKQRLYLTTCHKNSVGGVLWILERIKLFAVIPALVMESHKGRVWLCQYVFLGYSHT